MKFGIFYEHQLPRPWSEHAEYDLLQNSLDQVELADKLGYDYAWEVEHHFLEEYSHSSAPEVFLSAASQRTKQIRLAHGIIQLTTNHPARVAERVSTLDLISKGRVEMGIGEGSSITELHPFEIKSSVLTRSRSVVGRPPYSTAGATSALHAFRPLRVKIPAPIHGRKAVQCAHEIWNILRASAAAALERAR